MKQDKPKKSTADYLKGALNHKTHLERTCEEAKKKVEDDAAKKMIADKLLAVTLLATIDAAPHNGSIEKVDAASKSVGACKALLKYHFGLAAADMKHEGKALKHGGLKTLLQRKLTERALAQ